MGPAIDPEVQAAIDYILPPEDREILQSIDLAEWLKRDTALNIMLRQLALLPVLFCAVVLWAVPARALELQVAAAKDKPNAIVVTALDELDRPAAGAVVSFQLPASVPSGLFANGLRTEIVVAGPDGRAAVGGIQWDAVTDQRSIAVRISAAKDGQRAATVFEWAVGTAANVQERAPLTRIPSSSPSSSASSAVSPGSTSPRSSGPGSSSPNVAADSAVPVYHGGGSGRWGKRLLILAAVVGGVAAAGYTVSSRQSGAGAVVAPGGVTTPTFPLAIGQPILTVGKP